MSLGFAVVQLDVSVLNVAVRAIGADLGGGVNEMQWVLNAYTIGFAAFILSAGALGDRIGARRVFIAGFALFMVTSAICGLAPDLGVLIAARAIQGIAAAVLVPSSLTLLGHAYPEPAGRARAVGFWMAGSSVSFAAGPLIGGVLIAAFGWRAIFFINVPLALSGIALARLYARETHAARERPIDVPGQVLAVICLAVLVGATIEGGVHGFGSAIALGGFAGAAVTLAVFLGVEARRREPMLPLALFSVRTFSVSAVIGLLVNLIVYGLIFLLSLYFQTVQGHTPLVAGLALLPYVIAAGVGNVLSVRMSRRLGPVRAPVLSAGLMGAACLGLAWIGRSTPYAAIVAQLVCLGLGLGTIVPLITSELLGAVERSRSGVAAGTLNAMRQTGSALGVAWFGSLLSAGGGFVAGLRLALVIAAGLAGLTALLSTRMVDDRWRSAGRSG
ncbi:MAG TPA: MFS transporter [Solirubrobacteraceae bacterium]|nr:MFS transporter [Solirubrobacteraceae bacterium]